MLLSGVKRTRDVVPSSCIHVTRGVTSRVTCTRDIMSCSCLHVTRGVAHTGDIVLCYCIRVTCGVARTGDIMCEPIGISKGGPWALTSLYKNNL